MAKVLMAFATIAVAGCEPSPPVVDVQKPAVTLDPPAALDAMPAVSRIRVQGMALPPAALALFRGELSDYYAGQLRDGKIPASLAERRVAGEAWFDSTDNLTVFVPSAALVRDETYSLALLGGRPLAGLRVDGDLGPPYASRVWPPHEWPRGGARWVFCGEFGDVPRGMAVEFDPGKISALANPGSDSEGTFDARCVRIEPLSNPGSGIGVPPPRLSGTALDPASIDFAIDPAPEVVPCAEGEVGLGAVCADVEDDRVIVRVAGEPVLLALTLGGRTALQAVLPGAPIVFAGLPPSTRVTANGTTTDLRGSESTFSIELTTRPPLPHVVLNEVLANPRGPEPAQEWIELVNDGSLGIDLGDLTLAHSDGVTALPRVELLPGAFALLAAQNYEPADGQDVPPAPGTLIVRLPKLGLSNAGEALALRGADGAILSRFPAIPPPREGTSVGRRTPSSSDSDPSSFGPHAKAGASPGWQNDIIAP